MQRCSGENGCWQMKPLTEFTIRKMYCDTCATRLAGWKARFKNKQVLEEIEQEKKEFKSKEKHARKALRTLPLNHNPRYWD